MSDFVVVATDPRTLWFFIFSTRRRFKLVIARSCDGNVDWVAAGCSGGFIIDFARIGVHDGSFAERSAGCSVIEARVFIISFRT